MIEYDWNESMKYELVLIDFNIESGVYQPIYLMEIESISLSTLSITKR